MNDKTEMSSTQDHSLNASFRHCKAININPCLFCEPCRVNSTYPLHISTRRLHHPPPPPRDRRERGGIGPSDYTVLSLTYLLPAYVSEGAENASTCGHPYLSSDLSSVDLAAEPI